MIISNYFFEAINQDSIFYSFDTYLYNKDGNAFIGGRGPGRRPQPPFSKADIIIT